MQHKIPHASLLHRFDATEHLSSFISSLTVSWSGVLFENI